MALQQQVRLVLVVGRARHLRGGHQRRQPPCSRARREHLDVQIGQRQHRTDAVLGAERAAAPARSPGRPIRGTATRTCAAYCAGASGDGSATIVLVRRAKQETMS